MDRLPERLPDHVESPRLTIRRWNAGDADALSAAILASVHHLRPWMPWAADEPIGSRCAPCPDRALEPGVGGRR